MIKQEEDPLKQTGVNSDRTADQGQGHHAGTSAGTDAGADAELTPPVEHAHEAPGSAELQPADGVEAGASGVVVESETSEARDDEPADLELADADAVLEPDALEAELEPAPGAEAATEDTVGVGSTTTQIAEVRNDSTLVMGAGGPIEIAGLTPDQVSALKEQYAQGMIDVQRKASELKVDVEALDATLGSLTTQAQAANQGGVSVTATHTQSTSLGHTEIVLGNTDRAAKGKIAQARGSGDSQPLHYVLILAGAILVGAVFIALLV